LVSDDKNANKNANKIGNTGEKIHLFASTVEKNHEWSISLWNSHGDKVFTLLSNAEGKIFHTARIDLSNRPKIAIDSFSNLLTGKRGFLLEIKVASHNSLLLSAYSLESKAEEFQLDVSIEGSPIRAMEVSGGIQLHSVGIERVSVKRTWPVMDVSVSSLMAAYFV